MFLATVVAGCAGLLVGFARGGRLSRLGQLHIHVAWLAGLAWLVQVVLFVSPAAGVLDSWAAPIHLLSIVLLAAVIVVNRSLPGIGLLGLGLLLNASVYAANGGFMPVTDSALIASGNSASLAAMADGARFQKTFLSQPDTPLWFLGDLLPLPIAGKVYSIGDVIAAVGLFVLVAGGMLGDPSASPARILGAEVQRMIKMSAWERVLMFLPIPGDLVFGLLPLFVPVVLARALGYSGDDPYLMRLAGAATLGYAVALAFAVKRGNWLEARLVMVATLVFSVGALYACAVAFATGAVHPIVYVLVANSLMELAVSAWLLYRFRQVSRGQPDIPRAGVTVVVIATVAALATGLPALLLPQAVGRLLGYQVTDVIVLTLAGAATCGYAAMGALELRSRHWEEMRLPVLMAMVFNAAGLLATLVGLLEGGPILLPAVVLVATVIVTPAAAIALRRYGLGGVQQGRATMLTSSHIRSA
jgi:hypothetical protein